MGKVGFIGRALVVLVGAMSSTSPSLAQVFMVEPMAQADSAVPTPTFLWPGQDTKAVLIMIPGGDGHLGLTSERKDLGGFYRHTLKRLSDSSLTSGRLDVVVFDSPNSLHPGDAYPSSRTTSDHLDRIESVVRYYKDKLNKPVWLMGHSNGAVSVTEFWRSIHNGDKKGLIEGLVVSAPRNGISFPAETGIPVLFLHHENDGCPKADPRVSMKVYESLKSKDKNKVEYVWIKGGEDEPRNRCYSGRHMYFGAGDEAAAAIDRFIAK